MGESFLFLVPWATLPATAPTGQCAVTAVCRASSRMEAVELMRAKSLGGVSTREVQRLSTQRELELDLPLVAQHEVVVRDCDWGEWSPVP